MEILLFYMELEAPDNAAYEALRSTYKLGSGKDGARSAIDAVDAAERSVDVVERSADRKSENCADGEEPIHMKPPSFHMKNHSAEANLYAALPIPYTFVSAGLAALTISRSA